MTKQKLKKEICILHNYQRFFPGVDEFSIQHKKHSSLFVTKSFHTSFTYQIEKIFTLFDAVSKCNSFLDSELIDYEVLYIGKSLGNKTPSNAYKRIFKHDKLQEILANVVENEPYNEIFVLLFSVDNPSVLGISDARFYYEDADKNVNCIPHPLLEELSKKEIVDATEACLIKYFCPPYNTLFKNSTMSGKEKFLYKCKQHDINSIGVGFTTESNDAAINLFTKGKIQPQLKHAAKFRIHMENDRVSLQDILNQN
jgi:hypothetical protein